MKVINLDTQELDRIAANLGINRRKIGKRIAFEVEKEAKIRAPFDTTAMRNSIYTVTEDEDGYQQAASAVAELRPGIETEQHPAPGGNVIANVGPCVEYAEFVERGTSRMAAQPFLEPAVEAVGNRYNNGEAWEDLVK